MILRLISYFLFFCLTGCTDHRSEIDKVSDQMLCQLAKQMKKKGLIAIGSGGGCTIEKKINLISMTFIYRKVMNLQEARQLIVECTETLLESMNVNPENKQYFEQFPAPVGIIMISILGEECPTDLNCVDAVGILKGKITYDAINPLKRIAPYVLLKEETFEEAQKIVKSEALEGSFKHSL